MKTNLIRLSKFSLVVLALPFISACNGSYSSNPVADYSAYGAATGPADTKTPPDRIMLDPVDCNNMFTVATSTDQSTLVFRENRSSSYKITITSLYDTNFEVIPYNLPCANCFKRERQNGKVAIYDLTWNPGQLPPQQITKQTVSFEYKSERTDKRCLAGQRRQLEIQIESSGSGQASTPTPATSPSASLTRQAAAAPVAPTTPTTDKPTLAFVLSSFPQKPLVLGKDASFEFEILVSDVSFTKEIQPRPIWSAPSSIANNSNKLYDAHAGITCIPTEQGKEKSKSRFIGKGQWQITCKVTLANIRGIVAAAKTVKVLELGFTGKIGNMQAGAKAQVSEAVSSPIFSAQGGKSP